MKALKKYLMNSQLGEIQDVHRPSILEMLLKWLNVKPLDSKIYFYPFRNAKIKKQKQNYL